MEKKSVSLGNKWLEVKLSKFLKNHRLPKNEFDLVMKEAKVNRNISTCIDKSLVWVNCKRNVDFYYFLQLRWLLFLFRNATGKDKEKYRKELSTIHGYITTPNKFKEERAGKAKNLILSESEFRNRKKLFLQHILLNKKSK